MAIHFCLLELRAALADGGCTECVLEAGALAVPGKGLRKADCGPGFARAGSKCAGRALGTLLAASREETE